MSGPWDKYADQPGPWSQFSDKPQMNAAPTHEMQAAPGGIGATLHDFESDLMQGGSRTKLGSLMGKMQGRDNGFSGLSSGVGEGVAEHMGSLPLGLTRAGEGLTEIPSHPLKGLWDTGKGLLQASEIPGSFMGGPALEKGIEAIPSSAHAGQVLNDIAEQAKDVPVSLKSTQPEAERFEELTQRGGRRSKPLTQLVGRMQPGEESMNFPEARDFYTNVNDAAHTNTLQKLMGRGMKPTMRRQAVNVRRALNDDITDAAASIGRGDDYTDAMKEYANAMKLRRGLTYGGLIAGEEALRRLPLGNLIGKTARTAAGGQ